MCVLLRTFECHINYNSLEQELLDASEPVPSVDMGAKIILLGKELLVYSANLLHLLYTSVDDLFNLK